MLCHLFYPSLPVYLVLRIQELGKLIYILA